MGEAWSGAGEESPQKRSVPGQSDWRRDNASEPSMAARRIPVDRHPLEYR
jgi:hypothetical protein